MLLWLSQWLTPFFPSAFVLSYVTVRASLAMLLALITVIGLGNRFIAKVQAFQFQQIIRDDGPKSHIQKRGTPTLGGVLLLFGWLLSILLAGDLESVYLWLTLVGTLSFAALGFMDDYLKVVRKNHKGISARHKLFWQISISLTFLGILCLMSDPGSTEMTLILPVDKDFSWALGPTVFILFGLLVITGSSNAVNITDGLDGLAASLVILAASVLMIYAYIAGNPHFSSYLYQPYVPHARELVVILASLVGACLGFLWFNAYPAQLFMGDVGSLALGGSLGIIAILIRQELIFFLVSLVFVAEALSVMIQVGHYRLTGRRVFKMAPLHHHFEQLGLKETKVLMRFWIVGFVLALMALILIKIR